MTTNKQIKAGPELDALVAEYVMGWKRTKLENWKVSYETDFEMLWTNEKEHFVGKHQLPAFSTDIKAAFEVVEKLKYFVRISKNPNTMSKYKNTEEPESLKYCCTLIQSQREDIHAYADTAPLAIALAALKVVGYEL